MAKSSAIERNKKRRKLVAKNAARRAALKEISRDRAAGVYSFKYGSIQVGV